MARSNRSLLTGIPLLAVLCAGCVQTKITEPSRSAVEQLLLSTAATRAVNSIPLDEFRGKRIYVSTNYFEGYDYKFALAALRDALSRSGARLTDEPTNAEVIVEPRSAALSVDSANSLIGIPSGSVPIPLTGTFALPEVGFYKSQKQYSISKMQLLAYTAGTGEHVLSTPPMIGRAHNHYYQILWLIKYRSTDLPERSNDKPKKHPKGNFNDPPPPNSTLRTATP